MPSKSPAQERLMQAAAHTKGGFGGVSQKVGKEFIAADTPCAFAAYMDAIRRGDSAGINAARELIK